MSEKLEGTVSLDGLVEGPLPDDPGIEDGLEGWKRAVEPLGLSFHLEIRGGTFSLLPPPRPVPAGPLGAAPHEGIRQALDRLLGLLPAGSRGRVFSTLRSAEYRKGEEVQTLYLIDAQGAVQARSRVVEAATTPAPSSLPLPARMRRAAVGLVAALAILGVTSLFVDLRGLFGEVADALRPADAGRIPVDADAFRAFFTVEGKRIGSGGGSLVLTLRRTAGHPRTDADLSQAIERAGRSLPGRLALEAIASGYVRCELFDAEGRFAGFTLERVKGLRDRETIEVAVPLPERRRIGRIAVTY